MARNISPKAHAELSKAIKALPEGGTLTVIGVCGAELWDEDLGDYTGKKCRYRVRMEVGQTIPAKDEETARLYGKPDGFGTVSALTYSQDFVDLPTCPTCYNRLIWANLKVTYSCDVPCNGKCTQAISAECKCSCGGAYHGSEASD